MPQQLIYIRNRIKLVRGGLFTLDHKNFCKKNDANEDFELDLSVIQQKSDFKTNPEDHNYVVFQKQLS